MMQLGKVLIIAGTVFLAVGALMLLSDKIPFIGKLPGDIHIKRENFQIYFPVTTSILISVVINLVLWIFTYFNKK